MDIVSRESLSGGRGGFRAWGSCYIIHERAQERQGVRGKLNLSLIQASERERTHDVFLARTERIRDNVLHSDA